MATAATVKRYDELIAWQKAMDLAQTVYAVTSHFPREETYGLSAQMRKSAVSIPSNIAEGQGRRTTGEFLQHLSIAHGSLRELETQTVLAGRLGILDGNRLEELVGLCAEVGRLINGLSNSLGRKAR
jgi:four helix bundle protein